MHVVVICDGGRGKRVPSPRGIVVGGWQATTAAAVQLP